MVGFVVLAFELGLDQADEDGARLREPRERGRQGRQADEAEVGHQQVERHTQLGGIGQLDVGALEHRHARVLAQLPRQLPVVHVHARHAAGAGLQKAIGESARRAADIHAAHARDVLPERVERALQLVPAARDELLAALHHDVGIGRDLDGGAGGVHVVHLHLVRQNGAQHGAGVGEHPLLDQQLIQAYLFRFLSHAAHYSERPRQPRRQTRRPTGISPTSARRPTSCERPRRFCGGGTAGSHQRRKSVFREVSPSHRRAKGMYRP